MMAKHSRRSRGRGPTEQRTNFVAKIDAESSLSDEFDCYKLTFRTARVVHPQTARHIATATLTNVCRCRLEGGYTSVRRKSSWDEGGRGEQRRRRRGRKAFKNRLPPFVRSNSERNFPWASAIGDWLRPPACLPGWPTDWGRRESETRTPAAAAATEAQGRLGCRLPRAGIRRTDGRRTMHYLRLRIRRARGNGREGTERGAHPRDENSGRMPTYLPTPSSRGNFRSGRRSGKGLRIYRETRNRVRART